MAVDPRTGPLPEDDAGSKKPGNQHEHLGEVPPSQDPKDEDFFDFELLEDEAGDLLSMLDEETTDAASIPLQVDGVPTPEEASPVPPEVVAANEWIANDTPDGVAEPVAAEPGQDADEDLELFFLSGPDSNIAPMAPPDSANSVLVVPESPSSVDAFGSLHVLPPSARDPLGMGNDSHPQDASTGAPASGGDEDAFDLGKILDDGPGASSVQRRDATDGSSVNLGARPTGSSILLGGEIPSESSAIFEPRSNLVPHAPGSGWTESPADALSTSLPANVPVSSGDSAINIDSLFEEAQSVVAQPASGWSYEQPTITGSQSSILRDLESPDGQGTPVRVDKTKSTESSQDSDVMRGTDALAGSFDGPSGVNLVDPDYSLSDPQYNSQSSIFGNEAAEDASRIDLEALPPSSLSGSGLTFELAEEVPGNAFADAHETSAIDEPRLDLDFPDFEEFTLPSPPPSAKVSLAEFTIEDGASDLDINTSAADQLAPPEHAGDVSFEMPETPPEKQYETTLRVPASIDWSDDLAALGFGEEPVHTELIHTEAISSQAVPAEAVESASDKLESAGENVSFELPEPPAGHQFENTLRVPADDAWADDAALDALLGEGTLAEADAAVEPIESTMESFRKDEAADAEFHPDEQVDEAAVAEFLPATDVAIEIDGSVADAPAAISEFHPNADVDETETTLFDDIAVDDSVHALSNKGGEESIDDVLSDDDLAFEALADDEKHDEPSFDMPDAAAENDVETALNEQAIENELSFDMPDVSSEAAPEKSRSEDFAFEALLDDEDLDVAADSGLSFEMTESDLNEISDEISNETLRGPSSHELEDESAMEGNTPWPEPDDSHHQQGSLEWSVEPTLDEELSSKANRGAAPEDIDELTDNMWADEVAAEAGEDQRATVGRSAWKKDDEPARDAEEIGLAEEGTKPTRAQARTTTRRDKKSRDLNETRPLALTSAPDQDDFAPGSFEDSAFQEEAFQESAPVERTTRTSEALKSKRKSGSMAWISGGVLGLLIGAGSFAGLYFAQILPSPGGDVAQNKPAPTPVPAPATGTTPAANPGEIDRLNAEIAAAIAAETKAKNEALAQAKLLEAEKEKVQISETMLADKEKLLKTAMLEAAAAKEAQTKADTKLIDLTKDAADAKKLAEDKAKELADAEAKLVDAQKKQLAADEAVTGIVKELRANKLVDEKEEGPAILAKLPEIIKSAAAAATSADAKKAADTIAAARKQVDTIAAELKAAEAAMARAVEDAKLAAATAAKAKEEADDKIKKVQETAKAEAAREVEKQVAALQKKLDETTAELKKAMAESDAIAKLAQDEFTRKLSDADSARATEIKKLIEQHLAEKDRLAMQIAEVRAGARVPLAGAEVVANERAQAAYGTGLESYFARRYSDAQRSFATAIKDNPGDARYWYFLGLSELELGHQSEAEEAFKKGGELESRFKPGSREVGAALERVQGNARKALSPFRP